MPGRNFPRGRARSESFLQAHQDRLEDARALFRAKRWGGSIYLGGYVVECLLKASILARQGISVLPVDYWHHDLERLVDEAGLRVPLRALLNSEIRQRMTLLHGLWDVTIRYGGKRFVRSQAASALSAVEVIRTWLLGRLSRRG